MDIKRLITAVLVTMMVVFAYQIGMDWFARKMGWQTQRPAPTTQAAGNTATTAPASGPGDVAPPPSASIARPAVRVAPATAPVADIAELILGSSQRNDPTYRLAVELVPQGAAIDSVVLNEFTREVKSDAPYVFQQPLPGAQNTTRSMATRAAVVDGATVLLDGAPWTVESRSTDAATFSVLLEGDGGPIVRLRKSYRLLDRTDSSAGYEVEVTHSAENLTNRPVNVTLLTNGTLTPPREVDRGPDLYIVSGYDYDPAPDKLRVDDAHHAIEEFSPDKPVIDVTRYEDRPLVWSGALSVYFNAIARPLSAAGSTSPPEYLAKAEAVAHNPAAPPHERIAGVVMQTADLVLQPGQTQTLSTRAFFGPRQRKLLKQPYYAALGYDQSLVLTGGICAVCTFQWLIDVLVWMLRGFHWAFGGFAGKGDWGLAIIGLVVLVRVLLHPVTKKSQVSMMKMSKLGPEIERLRKKHGDNKDELNKAMMSFYKQQGFTPILGCLPMILQMPIWIALYSALNSTFELRHASFLWGFTWIEDLARPDHLIELRRPVDVWFLHITGLNLLPILMGLVFYFQMKIQPKPVSMTKEQEQQQKIMMWMMPILFPFMLYSGPSGLNLYILTSTLIGIWESKRIRDHIKQQDEAAAAGRVIVDAGPTREMKRRRDDDDSGSPARRRGGPSAPRTGLAGWLANLQERARQIRREAERKGK